MIHESPTLRNAEIAGAIHETPTLATRRSPGRYMKRPLFAARRSPGRYMKRPLSALIPLKLPSVRPMSMKFNSVSISPNPPPSPQTPSWSEFQSPFHAPPAPPDQPRSRSTRYTERSYCVSESLRLSPSASGKSGPDRSTGSMGRSWPPCLRLRPKRFSPNARSSCSA